MKLSAIIAAFLFLSCSSDVQKPDNLIPEDAMVEIFYDLAVMDAIKSHNPLSLETYGVQPDQYIYKKYGVDSLQFASSNKYYAADIKKYKSMYVKVNDRLKTEKAQVDEVLKKESKPGDLQEVVPVEKTRTGGFIR